MSKLLIRALKYSIAPAILMIAGKVLGIFVISSIYGLSLNIGNDLNGFFSTQIYFSDAQTTLFVNSFSDLAMIIVLFAPAIYLIIKTALFQNTVSNPKTIVKMAKFNMLSWVAKDDTTLLKIFVWSAFVILASVITVLNTYQGNTYTYIGIVSAICALLTALGSIKTFEVEINKVYPESKKYY